MEKLCYTTSGCLISPEDTRVGLSTSLSDDIDLERLRLCRRREQCLKCQAVIRGVVVANVGDERGVGSGLLNNELFDIACVVCTDQGSRKHVRIEDLRPRKGATLLPVEDGEENCVSGRSRKFEYVGFSNGIYSAGDNVAKGDGFPREVLVTRSSGILRVTMVCEKRR